VNSPARSSQQEIQPADSRGSKVSKRPLLLGHRGFRNRGLKGLNADLPAENSLAAFESALSSGCDGFEFDVRHTQDGRNVVWHDPDCNGRQIAATNYADLADPNGNNLSCLEDVLGQFGDRAYLDVELKVSGNEESIVTALRANLPQLGFIVSSFLPEVLLRLRELDGTIPLGFICDRDEAMSLWQKLPIRVFLPRHDLVTASLIDEVHRQGRQIMTWTVNSRRRVRQLAKWSIDGLISDDPQLLFRTFWPSL
jgi:glycerophosphoryl diester phosphodiesterase